MNYSQSLPKRNYETTIGSYTLVDFTSYYEINDLNVETENLTVDKSQTLVEAAYSKYKDVNSLWLFLVANKKINPFTLTKDSSSKEILNYGETTTVHALVGAYDLYTPQGSLLTPYSATGGSAWQFSYVGNFSITGGFVLSKDYNSFSRRTYFAEPQGITLATGAARYQAIVKGDTYYQYDLSPSPSGIQLTTLETQTNVTKNINYKSSQSEQPYLLLDSELPIFKKGSGPYEPTGITSASTFVNSAEVSNTTIKAFSPYSVGYKAFNLIKQNYKV